MVYFIEAVGAGLLKIGFTDQEASERLKQLQTGCPHPLRLMVTINGNVLKERSLHQMFGHLRTEGEWFRIDDELRWYVFWLRHGRPFVESERDGIAAVATGAEDAVAGVGSDVSSLKNRVAELVRANAEFFGRLASVMGGTRTAPATDDVVITDKVRRRVLEEFPSSSEIIAFMESDRGR